MHIRIGYELTYNLPQPTPMILMLNVHPERIPDLLAPDTILTDPPLPQSSYLDNYGNQCTRILAPAGTVRIFTDTVIQDSGELDPVHPGAHQHPVEELPDSALLYLLASRYCETDLLLPIAWDLFGNTRPGWERVQAVCSLVHEHITFGYHHASPTQSAADVWQNGQGVCRDFAHLAVTFCRCLNIPARYCTGYLGDIGVPEAPFPMDFSAWFEAYLDGQWHTFDARHNQPRIGRIVMARGRDAADVALATTFGPNILSGFKVWTDEIG